MNLGRLIRSGVAHPLDVDEPVAEDGVTPSPTGTSTPAATTVEGDEQPVA